jgi:hypothetical protein
MASYPDGPPEDPTGKFYLDPADQRKAEQKRINFEKRKESSDAAIASFKKSHTDAAALREEEQSKVNTFPHVMLEGIKIDERYNGRYIPELIQDQLMYVSNTKIEVDHGTHRSFVRFSCIRYLNNLKCWVVAPYSLAVSRAYFGEKLLRGYVSRLKTFEARHLPDEVVAYLEHEEMLKHNETPSTQLNALPNKNWHVYSGTGGYGERLFKLDEKVKVTTKIPGLLQSAEHYTLDHKDFLLKAKEKRDKTIHDSRKQGRKSRVSYLRSVPPESRPKEMDVSEEEERLGGSISKSSRYTKKSKTAKKRKNKRKTMRR